MNLYKYVCINNYFSQRSTDFKIVKSSYAMLFVVYNQLWVKVSLIE